MYDMELYHHGIRGQKWGVRRFQNKDGSLTKLGQKRVDKAQKKADKVAKKDEKKSGIAVKKKATVERTKTDEEINPNDLNARFKQMTGENVKSGGRGKISELAGIAGIAGVVGGAAALSKLNSNKLTKPEEFTKKAPERPKVPEDAMTNTEAYQKFNRAKSLYEYESKGFNAEKAEHDNQMAKYKEKVNARLNLTTTALNATKGASSGIVNMMEKSNERKAKDKAASLDLSHYSEKELRDYVSRYQAEEAFRNTAAKQFNSGRSKTMDIIETVGAVAGVGASVLGVYAAYKQVTNK